MAGSKSEYEQDFIQKKVRDKLNTDKIKLWLPPYTQENQKNGEIPQELVKKYSEDLGLRLDVVADTLEALRIHAVQKLVERAKFKSSGLATLRVKISRQNIESPTEKLSNRSRIVSVEIGLNETGSQLKQIIAESVKFHPDSLKLICQGHVISESEILTKQNVKNGSQVLCLCLSVTEIAAHRQQEEVVQMAKTRKAAELLSNMAEEDLDDSYYIQIADQSGKPLQLPPDEKKALTLAMTLHEKGRIALKNKEISQALLLLLEADKEFKKCRADILKAVDNYAVLCLDIVWCYLCLKNVEELPDAELRLRTSEDCFQRSYGSNMERLTAVKGGTGREQALFMRLHLLQGIVAFHQHRLPEATSLLHKAELELCNLQVDEDKLTEVMSVGFSEAESRLGLRACGGDIQTAVAHIMKRKEEKLEIAKKVKEERRKKRIATKLGKTVNGDKVNVDSYEMLISMGFPKGASAEALRQANNDVAQALEVLEKHPNLLNIPDPDTHTVPITDEMISQMVGMGFSIDMVRQALSQFNGDMTRATEQLVMFGGVLNSLEPGNSAFASPVSVPSLSPTSSSGASSPQKDPSQLLEEKKAIDQLVSDFPEDEEDYLDLTLKEESQFLQEYKALLDSIQK